MVMIFSRFSEDHPEECWIPKAPVTLVPSLSPKIGRKATAENASAVRGLYAITSRQKLQKNCRVWQGLKGHLNNSHWPLLYYFIGSSNDDISISNDPCTATFPVKIVGTLFVFSRTQCLSTRFRFNCHKQHWEGKNCVQWKCPNYFCLRL